LREQIGFHGLLRKEASLSVHILGMELNFNGLPNNEIHVLGFSGKDAGIVNLNALSN
jgi:hypothetical protein